MCIAMLHTPYYGLFSKKAKFYKSFSNARSPLLINALGQITPTFANAKKYFGEINMPNSTHRLDGTDCAQGKG